MLKLKPTGGLDAKIWLVKRLVVEPNERNPRWPKTDNGDENVYWKRYSLERAVV